MRITISKRAASVTALLVTMSNLYADTATIDGINWTYTVSNGEVSIGGGSSSSRAIAISTTGDITIPSTIESKPVVYIADYAFDGCSGLTSVTIPDSVTSIGSFAFEDCSGLTSVIFNGEMPPLRQILQFSEGIQRDCASMLWMIQDGGTRTAKG